MSTEGKGARALNDTIDALIREGDVRRIVVRDDTGATVLDLPVAIGIAAVVIAPVVAVAATAIGLVGGWRVDVERREDGPVEPPESTEDTTGAADPADAGPTANPGGGEVPRG